MAVDPAPASSRRFILGALATLRRGVVMRHVQEMAGIGLACGCLSGSALIGLGAMSQDVARLRLALCAGALSLAGGAIGTAWGWMTRQDIHTIARRVDHRRQLADLITTSLWILHQNKSAPDSMNQCVLAMAAQALEPIRSADIAQPRFGRRAWSGIVTSGLLLLLGIGWMSVPQNQAIGSSQALLARVQGLPVDQPADELPASVVENAPMDGAAAGRSANGVDMPRPGGMPSSVVHSQWADDRAKVALPGASGTSRTGSPDRRGSGDSSSGGMAPQVDQANSMATIEDAIKPPQSGNATGALKDLPAKDSSEIAANHAASSAGEAMKHDEMNPPARGDGLQVTDRLAANPTSSTIAGGTVARPSVSPRQGDEGMTPPGAADETQLLPAGTDSQSTTASPEELPVNLNTVPAELRLMVRDFFSE